MVAAPILPFDIFNWGFVAILVALAVYIAGTWRYDHFSLMKVPYSPPMPFLGSMAPFVFRRRAFPDLIKDIYFSLQGKRLGGVYEFLNPVVLLRDPELIKMITVKDYEYFIDHRVHITEKVDPIFRNSLFSLQGKKWKDMRAILTPAFTPAKMKAMFQLVSECGVQMTDHLGRNVAQYKSERGEMFSVELKDFFTRFTVDLIASAAFGTHCDSLKELNNDFYHMGTSLTNFGGIKSFIFMGYMICPNLMSLLNIPFVPRKMRNFFRSLVHDTITTREQERIVRPDMIHMVMQARKGKLRTEAEKEETTKVVHKETNTEVSRDDDITAQMILFLLSGLDTVSTLLSFAAYQLTVNQGVQRRLQAEIDGVSPEGGTLTYESVLEMKYLDMVVAETLRLHPPAALTDRTCARTYTIPATGHDPEVTLRKGDGVWIPIYALHRDPQHFPDPERFDPERFSERNKGLVAPFTYLPFGAGPRNCIGMHFALMEVKMALVHLLSRCSLYVVSKTPVPIRLAKKGFNMSVDNGFWVGAEVRNK